MVRSTRPTLSVKPPVCGRTLPPIRKEPLRGGDLDLSLRPHGLQGKNLLTSSRKKKDVFQQTFLFAVVSQLVFIDLYQITA